MFGRTARWNSCVSPASAVLRDAFAFPAFAFGVAPNAATNARSCESGACESETCELPTYRLAVDVTEEKRDAGRVWVIVANVPGFKKDQIAIELKDGVLSIDAKRATQAASSDATVYRRERRAVNFSRQIQLPETAADEGVVATLTDGVLTVTVPQKPEALPRKISID